MKFSSKILLLTLACLTLTVNSAEGFLSEVNADKKTIEVELRNINREGLKDIALGCEKYLRDKKNIHLLGGLEDYIETLSDNEILKVIYDYTNAFDELNDLAKLKAFVQKRNDPTTFEEKLNALSRFDLVNYALQAEEYFREQETEEGEGPIIGGLHDYINKLENKDIVEIVIQFSEKYADIKAEDFMKKRTEGSILTETQLKDALAFYEHDDLAKLAIAIDQYDNDHSKVQRIGGLHDYAYKLTNTELIDVIIEFSKRWPEIKDLNFIETLGKEEYDLIHSAIGGFEDYAWKLDRDDLRKIALASETYHRNKKNIHVLGGLHDYIDSLKTEQILKIVMEYVDNYPEMRVPGFIEKLADIPLYGFEESLKNIETLEKVRSLAITIENYDREIRQIKTKGGFHDFAYRSNREQLIDYIMNKAAIHSKIRTASFLNELIERS